MKAQKDECLMIGDDIEADILGAKNFGIDQILFDPNPEACFEDARALLGINNAQKKIATHTVSQLIDLKMYL